MQSFTLPKVPVPDQQARDVRAPTLWSYRGVEPPCSLLVLKDAKKRICGVSQCINAERPSFALSGGLTDGLVHLEVAERDLAQHDFVVNEGSSEG